MKRRGPRWLVWILAALPLAGTACKTPDDSSGRNPNVIDDQGTTQGGESTQRHDGQNLVPPGG
jgi:hypothetical protein